MGVGVLQRDGVAGEGGGRREEEYEVGKRTWMGVGRGVGGQKEGGRGKREGEREGREGER